LAPTARVRAGRAFVVGERSKVISAATKRATVKMAVQEIERIKRMSLSIFVFLVVKGGVLVWVYNTKEGLNFRIG
jgi:hypothetical protein